MKALALCLAAWLLLAGGLAAQGVSEPLRRLTLQRPEELSLAAWTRPETRPAAVEFGAWSAPAYLVFGEPDNNASARDAIESTLVLDQRLWARWDTGSGQTVYARLRHLDFQFGLAPGTAAPRFFEEGLHLDLAYVDLPADDFEFRLGRQFFYFGRGIVMNFNLDAVRASFSGGQWSGQLFAGRTPDYQTDLDPVVGRSNRRFTGAWFSYLTRSDHKPFVYFVDQDDRNDATLSGQGVRYDSSYVAVGSEGPLVGDVGYYLEAIREGGHSSTAGSSTGLSGISARAFLGEVTFHPDRRHHPTVTLGAYAGSGDPDRGSVVTAAAGSRAGTEDTAFVGTGRFDAELALSPRLSNLVALRLGGTYQFLEKAVDDEILEAAASVWVFRKDEPAGPISNGAASLPDGDVGTSLDAALAWKPAHDLTVALRASRFYPGDAFLPANRDPSTTVYTSFTYSY